MISQTTYQTHTYPLYLHGEWQMAHSGQTLPLTNPANENTIGYVAQAGPLEIKKALQTSQQSLFTWNTKTPQERADVLKRAANILESEIDWVAPALTEEQGKPLQESYDELRRALEVFRWTADHATHDFSQSYDELGVNRFTRMTPLGVVAAFTPWNYPAVICARKLAPALVAGCSVILKAAEETPSVAVAIVDALHRASLPQGTVTLLFGNPAFISETLLASSVIQKLTFTGSTAIGQLLAKQASANLIQCTLELGGHAPVIIDETVDTAEAVQAIGAFKFADYPVLRT